MFDTKEYFFPRCNHLTFVIIGCGGTGSYVVRDLARLIAVNNQKYNVEYEMLLYDADIVEEKNLARQNFIFDDLGLNKAEVLAERYSSSFGINISYLPKYFSSNDEEINSIRQNMPAYSGIVFIGCVDNNASRVEINNAYKNYNDTYTSMRAAYIDAGNEEFAGQVCISSNKGIFPGASSLEPGESGFNLKLPTVIDIFNITANDKKPDELSCAERAMSAPQNIMTNIWAAQVIVNYCSAIISGAVAYKNPFIATLSGTKRSVALPLVAKSISSILSFFDVKTGNIKIRDIEILDNHESRGTRYNSNIYSNCRENYNNDIGSVQKAYKDFQDSDFQLVMR